MNISSRRNQIDMHYIDHPICVRDELLPWCLNPSSSVESKIICLNLILEFLTQKILIIMVTHLFDVFAFTTKVLFVSISCKKIVWFYRLALHNFFSFWKYQVPIKWDSVDVTPRPTEDGRFRMPQSSLDIIRKHGIGLKGPLATPIGKGHQSLNLALRKWVLFLCNALKLAFWFVTSISFSQLEISGLSNGC